MKEVWLLNPGVEQKEQELIKYESTYTEIKINMSEKLKSFESDP